MAAKEAASKKDGSKKAPLQRKAKPTEKSKGTTKGGVLRGRAKPGQKSTTGDSSKVPKGGRKLSVAEKSLRDTLIVQRVAQGWTWEEISDEVQLSVSACKRAFKKKKEVMDDLLDIDPLEIIKSVIEGFQASIGDLEKMAVEYAAQHPSAAVGAKKGADDARRNLIVLLQSIGVLPRELGTMRFVVEIRAVVQMMVDATMKFEKKVEGMDMEPKQKKIVLAASKDLRKTLKSAADADGDVG